MNRFSHSKSPLNVCPSAFTKQIDGINNVPTKQKQRMRTSSMPAENRKVIKEKLLLYNINSLKLVDIRYIL